MRRYAHCMILLLLPATAWAYDDPASARGACVYAAGAREPGTDTPAVPARTPPAAKPAAATTGGGSDGDALVPRMHMPRWHSFLPGMFR